MINNDFNEQPLNESYDVHGFDGFGGLAWDAYWDDKMEEAATTWRSIYKKSEDINAPEELKCYLLDLKNSLFFNIFKKKPNIVWAEYWEKVLKDAAKTWKSLFPKDTDEYAPIDIKPYLN